MAKLNTEIDMTEIEELKKKKQEAEAALEKEALKEEEPEPAVVDGYNKEILEVLEKQGVTEADLDQAKEAFGKIFCFPWNDEKIYILRALTRREWNGIREAGVDNDMFTFLILKQGCLHPKFTSLSTLQEEIAGIQDTLSEVIMRTSGFITVEEAMSTVREL